MRRLVEVRAVSLDDAIAETGREAPVGESALDTPSDHVARNREQLERLRRLVARLSDDDLRRELPDGWAVADALAHLAFYDRRAQILLERFAREGVFSSPYDYETINSSLLHLTRRIPPREIAAEVLAAAEAADYAAAATPAPLVAEIRRLNQVKLERAEHRRSHLDDIEALLAST
jgi:Mycothiol maleylpyruvate isomerase N-terminal domain